MPGWRDNGPVLAASWPAAAEAGRLLQALGASVRSRPSSAAALTQGHRVVTASPTTSAQDWAGSGAMAITGERGSTVVRVDGAPATLARAAALAFELLTGVSVDGPGLLGERAAVLGLSGGGRVSAGGGSRVLAADQGWWALNLARDHDLVAALVESETELRAGPVWAAVEEWSSRQDASAAVARARLLGLAAGRLGETPAPPAPWRVADAPAHKRTVRPRPLVVNLGALWAAPLTGHLLGLAGAQIVDVESARRPDPGRVSTPEFYRLLHGGHELLRIDFDQPGTLSRLLADADIVIEASRPRALLALGVNAGAIMADGRARTWLRITGHRAGNRIAFGDDAAVAGGLVAWTEAVPVFAGDAIADPLTGQLGALAIVAHYSRSRAAIIDIALAVVAAYARSLAPDGLPRPRSRAASEPVTGQQYALPHVAARLVDDSVAAFRN